MPELPEVETVKRGLEKLLVGKTIAKTWHDWPKSFPNAKSDVDEFVIGATVIAIQRRAKVLLIELSTNHTLVTHLKMTGQLVYRGTTSFGAGHPNDSLIGHLPDKSTRVIVEFSDASKLYFNDQRKFGWMKLFATLEVPEIDFMKRVGPEPLEDDFTAKQFSERFKRRANTSIKAALLDQTVVAGVGNIYADESLWGAQIDPRRKVASISKEEFTKLYEELRAVMNLAIEKGGSTDRNYVNAEGKRGSYMDFARVFRRDGLACPRCGNTISKIRHAGRGTHLCETCQT
ncbi:TPA: DNA-formamidopyrimidine glycosylase [Candidatus Saccharibacteria bacterium]|nr:DNA-formamidopyrimidine glycosylase [Candidatus Saccharibacteria bacterium]